MWKSRSTREKVEYFVLHHYARASYAKTTHNDTTQTRINAASQTRPKGYIRERKAIIIRPKHTASAKKRKQCSVMQNAISMLVRKALVKHIQRVVKRF